MGCYQIWAEGYRATGNEGEAIRLTDEGVSAGTFQAACDKFALNHEGFREHYDPKSLTYWGCKLFDNEDSARASFG